MNEKLYDEIARLMQRNHMLRALNSYLKQRLGAAERRLDGYKDWDVRIQALKAMPYIVAHGLGVKHGRYEISMDMLEQITVEDALLISPDFRGRRVIIEW
jgi:hypothetical protein